MRAHVLRDGVFGIADVCMALVMMARRYEQTGGTVPPMVGKMTGPISEFPPRGDERERSNQLLLDDIFCAGVAGAVALPLDFIMTRMLVSGRPSAWRTVKGVARLGMSRGFRSIFAPKSLVSGSYVVDCMARPVERLLVYVAVRALLLQGHDHAGIARPAQLEL